MKIVTLECERCGNSFSYEHKRGRPRKLCDDCRDIHAPKEWVTSSVPNDFHVHLNPEDRHKLQFIIDNLGVGRIESIRTAIRVYHAMLLRDMSRR